MCQSCISPPCEPGIRCPSGITDGELNTVIENAALSFRQWRDKPGPERARVAQDAAGILRNRMDEFATPAAIEFNRTTDDVRREVIVAADVIDYFARASQSVLESTKHFPANAVEIGIIFGSQPNEFPYFQLARLTALNLMEGNVIILHHVTRIPPCAVAFELLWLEAGAPIGAFANLILSPAQAERILADGRIKCASNGGMNEVNRVTRMHAPVSIDSLLSAFRRRGTATLRNSLA